MPSTEELSYLKFPLKRVGSCDSCRNTYPSAWCCSDQSVIEFVTAVLDDEMAEFCIARGIKVADDHRAHFDVRQVCPHYNTENRKCKIHPTRPRICRNFPYHFGQLWVKDYGGKPVKYCSYDWDLNTNVEIDIDLIQLAKVMRYE